MKKWLIPVLLFIGTLLIYIHNLSSSVFGGDAGDLISAIFVRGVAHPSGYPLFTILGIGVSLLPFPFSLSWKVGLLSAIFSSLSVSLFYVIAVSMTKAKLASFIAALSLAFFYLFWLYSEIGEVFSLAVFFLIVLIGLALFYYQTKSTKVLYGLSFAAGLSLSHHEVTLAFFPSLLLLVLWKNIRILKQWKTVVFCLLLFFAGLIPYVYIPLAASHNPVINWDHASSLSGFLQLLLRKDYGWSVNTASYGIGTRLLALQVFAFRIFTELTPAGIFLIACGVFAMVRRKLIVLALALLLGFIFFGPVYILYGFTPLTNGFIIGTLERFYLLSSIFLFFFLPFGIDFVARVLQELIKKLGGKKSTMQYTLLFTSLFFILPFSLLRYNFSKTDLSHVFLGDYIGKDLLTGLPSNAVLFLQGDNFFFNTEYVQYVLGYRKDVQVLNIGTLQTTKALEENIRDDKKQHPTYTKDTLYLRGIERLAETHPVFAILNLQYKDKKFAKISWVPLGMVYELLPRLGKEPEEETFLKRENEYFSESHVSDVIFERQRYLSSHAVTLEGISQAYATAYTNAGNFFFTHYDDAKKAESFFEKALYIDSNAKTALSGLGLIALQKGQCRNAESLYKKAIETNPIDKNLYYYLYADYLTCFKDTKKATELSKKFEQIFQTTLPKDLQSAIQ